jgi:putative transposase
MDKKELQTIPQAAAKSLKTKDDLNKFRQILTKITVETALNVDLGDHLGYDKHESANSENSRNG